MIDTGRKRKMYTFKELVENYIDVTEHESEIAHDERYITLKNQILTIKSQIEEQLKNNDKKHTIIKLIEELSSTYLTLSSQYRYLDFKTAFLAGIIVGMESNHQNDQDTVKMIVDLINEERNSL